MIFVTDTKPLPLSNKSEKQSTFSGDVVIELAHESGFATTKPLRESLKMSRDHLKKRCISRKREFFYFEA